MGEKLTTSVYFPLCFIIATRLFHLSLVRSWFVPDEYWQSLEVAHHIVFDYGYLTWEWSEGIRSYLYVVFVAFPYYLLKCLHLDYVQLLIFIPRLVQTLISSLADLCILHWISFMTCRPVATLAGVFLLTSACVAYCVTRTIINTVEMNLASFALALYPWPHKEGKQKCAYIWIVAFSCLLRPTSCILWLPLCSYDIWRSPSPLRRILYKFLPMGLSSLLLSTLLDTCMHGSWTLSPWNFLRLNVLSGVASHYSVHPWHWYLTSGVPSVLGCLSVPFYVYVGKTLYQGRTYHAVLFGSLVWTVFVYSCIGHKEFRFLLPLFPIMLLYASLQVYSWINSFSSSLTVAFISSAVLIETALLVWLSLFHQVGVLNIMPHLRSTKTDSVLFLMPCHSTPLYSHLHRNISARFLTCDPNLASLAQTVPYVDEADMFYRDPTQWLNQEYGSSIPGGPEIGDKSLDVFVNKNTDDVNTNSVAIDVKSDDNVSDVNDSFVNDVKFVYINTFDSGSSLSLGKKNSYVNSPERTVDSKVDSLDEKTPMHFSSTPDKSKYWSKLSLPNTVVCFDVLAPHVQGWLKDNGFVLEREIYHTLLTLESRIGRYVLLYRRSVS